MKSSKLSILALLALVVSACTNVPSISTDTTPPTAFHDTRLQYALITGDNDTLAKDFNMRLPPSWAERVVGGMVIPLTAASEAAFFPFATAINAYAPAPDRPLSPQ